MVKRLLLVACMLLSINMLHAQEKIKTTAEQVTFYIDGAQVTRTKTLNLTAGETTLLFTGMSPYMDAKSMQVKAQGKLTVLGVNHQFNYTDSLERSALTMKMEMLTKKSYELQASKEVVQAQIDLLSRKPHRHNLVGHNQGDEQLLCHRIDGIEKKTYLHR